MAERKSAPRKAEVDTRDDPHKKRERIIRIVLLVGAIVIVIGMVLLSQFLSGSN